MSKPQFLPALLIRSYKISSKLTDRRAKDPHSLMQSYVTCTKPRFLGAERIAKAMISKEYPRITKNKMTGKRGMWSKKGLG